MSEPLTVDRALGKLETWVIFANHEATKETYRKEHPAPEEEVIACIATELIKRISNEPLEKAWSEREWE